MAKKITVAIDTNGRMVIDFDGFLGDDCFVEAERLQKELAKFGVEVEVVSRKRKPPKVAERQEDSGSQQTRNKH